MKRYYLCGIIIILLTGESHAQVAINADNTLPAQSAMLDVKSATKGMLVPRLTQGQLENNPTLEKYCYGNLESNCDIYGGLYQWGELMQFVTTTGAQGICFDGWHLPSDEDLVVLTNFLAGLSVAGGKLKEGGISYWQIPNTGATNESGFTALPGSFRDYLGSFSGLLGYRTSFWSSTQNGGSYAWDYSLYYDAESVVRSNGALKTNGFSVRCIKNEPF
jgi:uncharacterized protein (TIGR02145 family)